MINDISNANHSYYLSAGGVYMTTKYQMIGLTSLILTASSSIVYSEPNYQTDNLSDSSVFLGSHGASSEGGESGEGGFQDKSLESDDLAFGQALMVVQAHYAIGQKLYKAKEYDAASAFFGHPITEVLIELEPAFKQRNIPSIGEDMYHLLEISGQPDQYEVLKENIDNISNKVHQIFEILKNKDSENYNKMVAKINADMIRRSKLEFLTAIKKRDIGHLHDSIGYFDTAFQMYQENKAAYMRYNPVKIDQLEQLFSEIKPYYDKFNVIIDTAQTSQFAGGAAKIELILMNL